MKIRQHIPAFCDVGGFVEPEAASLGLPEWKEP